MTGSEDPRDEGRTGPSFWQELKRRRVYTVGTAYLVAGWVAIEATGAIFPALGFPEWAHTLVVVLTIAGFPVALVAAWLFEVTRDGVLVEGDAGSEPLRRAVTRWMRSPTVRGALIGGLLVTAVGVSLVVTRWRAASAPGGVDSLVVLPLANLSNDASREFFSDGMTEALISNLSKIDSLRVISRTSAMKYKDSELSPARIARELGVDGAIEGSVIQTENGQVRISVRLLAADTERALWTESYERHGSDVLALQSEVARAIATQIRLVLSPADSARLAVSAPVDTAVTNPYYRGLFFWWKRTPNDLLQALEQFELAIARSDSTFAPAFAGVADTYGLLGCCGYDVFPPTEAMPKAERAARIALALDPQLADAHAALAWVAYNFDWDWATAEASLRRALELKPGFSTGRMWLSGLLGVLGRFDEAHEWAVRALETDPVSLIVNANVGLQDYNARRHLAAIEQLTRTLELEANFPIAILWRAKAFWAAGELAAARADAQRFAEVTGRSALSLAYLAFLEGAAGNQAAARAATDELERRSHGAYTSSYAPAVAHLGLGDRDRAMMWLERAFAERSDFLIYLGVDAVFDPLREDPRFRSLVARIGLPLNGQEAVADARLYRRSDVQRGRELVLGADRRAGAKGGPH